MRRLIVNADDFGLTSGVNRAIAEAHASGILSSVTLMANGPAFQEAILLSRNSPNLSVGCHVVLADGTPVSEPSSISTLLVGNQPRFRDSLAQLATSALLGRLDPAQIEGEAIQQIRKIQSAGIAVSHLDTHKHTHLFPVVLEGILRAAAACGVPAVRNPIEPRFSQAPLSATHWKRRTQIRLLRTLAGDLPGRVRAAGLATTNGTLGILATGSLTLDLFRRIIDTIPQGTWEFVCHPGYDDTELRATGTRLTNSRFAELNILTSDEARRILDDASIQLISFRELSRH